MAYDVKELDVFQRAYRMSLEIHRLSLDFPKIEQYVLADQMRRSSKSIIANLAEGFGKQTFSDNEFKRFVNVAIGSCEETRIWLMYARDLEYIDQQVWETFENGYKVVAKQLVTLYKKIS